MNRQRASRQRIDEPRAPTRERRFLGKRDPERADRERTRQRTRHHAAHPAHGTESGRDDRGGDLKRRRRDRTQQNETSSPPRNRADASSQTTNRDRHREPKSRPSGQSRLSIRAAPRRHEATEPAVGRATAAPARRAAASQPRHPPDARGIKPTTSEPQKTPSSDAAAQKRDHATTREKGR